MVDSARCIACSRVVAEVTTASVAELRLQTGTTVWATVKATEVSAYPA